MLRNKKGFTLVELLAVIVVLAIIALIGYSTVGNIIESAEISANKQTVMNYARAISEARYLHLLKNSTEPVINEEWLKSVKFSNDNLKCDNIVYKNDDLIMTGCKFSGKDDNIYGFFDGKSYVGSEYKDYSENLAASIESSDFTYNKDGDYWSVTMNKNSNREFSSCINVDTDNTYLISVDIKTDNLDAIFYGGIRQYDEVGAEITPPTFMYYSGYTLSKLATDLNVEDTTVTIKPATGVDSTKWKEMWQKDEDTKKYNGFIFWNYGYPEQTYSQNAYSGLFSGNDSVKVNNDGTITITLDALDREKNSWITRAVPAGTSLSRSSSGATYNYGLITKKSLSTDYVTKSLIINGTSTNGKENNNKFRPGTKCIRLGFSRFTDDSSKSQTNIYIKNILVKKI